MSIGKNLTKAQLSGSSPTLTKSVVWQSGLKNYALKGFCPEPPGRAR